MDRLKAKVCLVTGAGGAIGRAIVEAFQEQGAIVVATDISQTLLNATVAAVGCEGIKQDVTNEGEWDAIIAEIEAKHGRLDVLVNNAGILGSVTHVSPETTQVEDFRRLQLINVESVMLGCRAAIPAMKRAGGGSIINLSSIAAAVATPFEVGYGASKAGVRHLSWSVAAHGGPFNIRCNAILPGQIETGGGGMMDTIFKGAAERGESHTHEAARDSFTSLIPLGRLGTPYDIAMGAVYLASDESRYVSSISLQISGGWSVL